MPSLSVIVVRDYEFVDVLNTLKCIIQYPLLDDLKSAAGESIHFFYRRNQQKGDRSLCPLQRYSIRNFLYLQGFRMSRSILQEDLRMLFHGLPRRVPSHELCARRAGRPLRVLRGNLIDTRFFSFFYFHFIISLQK